MYVDKSSPVGVGKGGINLLAVDSVYFGYSRKYEV